MTRVFVTGANGHIGSNTVRSLIRHGHEVVPFVRATSDLRSIEKLGLTYQFGDVRDYPSLLKAMQGCDAIIHHATVYRVWAKNPDDILQPALEGTRNLFKAAKESGVRRVVYTSSIVAVGYLRKLVGLRSEKDWNEDAKSPYAIAKTQSERDALRLSQEYDIPTIRLCPATVLGPYDYGITPSTKVILGLIDKSSTTYEGGSNYVHVQDVAEVHALAVEKGEPGGRYIVGGDNLHLKDVAGFIRQLTGVEANHFGLTGPAAEFLGAILGAVGKISGSEPMVTREIAQDFVGRYGYFDCSLTNQTFGINPRNAEETIKDTIRWLLFLGKFKPEIAERISSDFPADPDW
jgi:dihydroflavonol-4-reductase